MKNSERAELGRQAALDFARHTNQINAGDWEHDRTAVYSDLIIDILHAAREDIESGEHVDRSDALRRNNVDTLAEFAYEGYLEEIEEPDEDEDEDVQ